MKNWISFYSHHTSFMLSFAHYIHFEAGYFPIEAAVFGIRILGADGTIIKLEILGLGLTLFVGYGYE